MALFTAANGLAARPIDDVCPIVAPVGTVEGRNWYSDAAGSNVDAAAEMQHQVMIRPLRSYSMQLVQAVERGDTSCVSRQLAAWAKANALLGTPDSFAAQRERLRFGTAISFAVLRLMAAGQAPERKVVGWIRSVNIAATQDFRHRGVVDNLYVWSGVAAALAWVVTDDNNLRAFAGEVMSRSTAQIQQDGLIGSELRRRTRSLLYHSYYLSGLLILGEALPPSPLQNAAIDRLYGRVRSGSCASQRFPGGQPQTPPNGNDLGVIAVLAAWQARPSLCGIGRAKSEDPLRGGDLRASLQAVRTLGRRP